MLSDLEVQRIPSLCRWPISIEVSPEDPDLYLFSFMVRSEKMIFSTRFRTFKDKDDVVQEFSCAEEAAQMIDGMIYKIITESVTE